MYGLCFAAEQFDPKRSKFSTYAVWVCRRVLHDLVRAHRAGQGQNIGEQRSFPILYRAIHDLTSRYGRKPTVEELVVATGWTEHRVTMVLEAEHRSVVSLESGLDVEGEDTLHEVIADRSVLTPERRLELQQQLSFINDVREDTFKRIMASKWTDQEKRVFTLRYRLGEPGLNLRTLIEIGSMVNVSEGRISQVLSQCWQRFHFLGAHEQVTPRWLRSLPWVAMALADVFGEVVVTSLFGERSLWEYVSRQGKGKSMARKVRAALAASPLTTREEALMQELRAIGTVPALSLVDVISRLPHLTARNHTIVSTRFGFIHGDLVPVNNADLAERMELKAQSVGTAVYMSLEVMRKNGLSKMLTVHKLNQLINEVRGQSTGTTSAQVSTETSPAAKPKAADVRPSSDLRDALKRYVASRRLEERIILMWVAGTEQDFGPMDADVIASRLNIPEADVDAILDRFRGTM